MNALTQYPEQIESLINFIKSRKIDISTQEKFTQSMKDWYKNQRDIDNKIELMKKEMPFSSLEKLLNI